jgi:hypothetical protein
MNREEKIKQAASKYVITDMTCGIGVRTQAFIDGAKWADEYLKSPWHYIADGDLPQTNKVTLFSFQGLFYIGYMRSNGNVSLKDASNLLYIISDFDYWMEIPDLPND